MTGDSHDSAAIDADPFTRCDLRVEIRAVAGRPMVWNHPVGSRGRG